MASYQVLPAPNTSALPRSLGHLANAFSDAAIGVPARQREKQAQQAQMSKYQRGAEDAGLELDSLSFNDTGSPSYSYKRRQEEEDPFAKDPKKAIMQAMLGIGNSENTGEQLGISRPQPMAQQDVSQHFPIASMTGQGGNISTTGGTTDYGQVVQESLKERFAPDMSQNELSRDYLGLPQAPVDVPPDFSNDVKQLKEISGGNQEVFVSGLEKLAQKYTDSPEALKRIKLIRGIFSGDSPLMLDETLLQE